jgi:NADH dehydrogenase
MIDTIKRPKVVIVGGGFAGIEVARAVAKSPIPVDVILVSKDVNFQYYPSLYRLVVGAAVNQVSIPLRRALPQNVSLVIDTYMGVDPVHKVITLQHASPLHYDYLVMALGSEPNYFGIAGMEQQSKSFLSIDKAMALKKYFIEQIEKSKGLAPEEMKKQLHTVIVGAGPSGTELAGVLPEFLKTVARKNGISPDVVTVDILDSAPRVLASIPEQASALVTKQLQSKGVTVYANYGVSSYDGQTLSVTNKNNSVPEDKKIAAATVIWTAGTKINSLFAEIPGVTMIDRKRVQVTDTLTLPNDDHIYVAGDGAGTQYSGLAQTAIDTGQYIGKAILARLENKPVAPYIPQAGTFVIPVGKQWAILNKKTFVASGIVPWFIRILVDIRYFMSITSFFYPFSMLKKNSK